MSKTPKPKLYKFKIDVFTPDTMPMARLAEYMASLAKFLGEPTLVHFVELKKGSTVLVHKIETEAVPKIQDRIERVKRGEASPEEIGPYKALNEMLRQDNCIASLIGGQKGKLLKFPGRDEKLAIDYGGISQEGTIEGVPIRVGGRKEIVHITVEEEDREYSCEAPRDVAKRIAAHLFTTPLRLLGRGRWHRDHTGEWVLDSFKISDFVILKDAPLSVVVDELQAVNAIKWDKLKDPWTELKKIRHGSNGDK